LPAGPLPIASEKAPINEQFPGRQREPDATVEPPLRPQPPDTCSDLPDHPPQQPGSQPPEIAAAPVIAKYPCAYKTMPLL
jgi:hypothetical protein